HATAAYTELYGCFAPPRPWIRGLRSRDGIITNDHAAAPAPGQVPPGQVDERRDPVPAAQQCHEMQSEPGQPGERSGGTDPAWQLDHRRAVPDRRHDALVLVAEGLCRLAGRKPADLHGGMGAALEW